MWCGGVFGEVAEGVVEGVAGPVVIWAILSEGVGEEVCCRGGAGDALVIGMDGVGC